MSHVLFETNIVKSALCNNYSLVTVLINLILPLPNNVHLRIPRFELLLSTGYGIYKTKPIDSDTIYYLLLWKCTQRMY